MSSRTGTSSGQRRNCRCPVARHKHGTVRAYQADGCRCRPCTSAHSRKLKHARYRMAVVGIRTELTVASAVGVARRLQALACIGWSTEDLAPLLATAQPNIARWRTGKQTFVKPDTAARVAAVYDDVWDQPPPGRYVEKVLNLAARQGWAPPMAWDDDDVDNPAAVPHLDANRGRELRPCGTLAAHRRHQRRGEEPCDACRQANIRREDAAA